MILQRHFEESLAQASFAAQSNPTLVRAGDSIRVGRLRLDVLHTPGHTPEHLVFFVGDVGKNLGSAPSTTLREEMLTNWGLRCESEAAFVHEVLAGQPEPPAYFREMKRRNRDGPAFLGGIPEPEVPLDRPVAVHCAGGARSPIAVSVMRRAGITGVLDVRGGFAEHLREGLPVEEAAGGPGGAPGATGLRAFR